MSQNNEIGRVNAPVTHLSHSELEDPLATGFQCASQVTIRESTKQMVIVVYHKKASATFTGQLYEQIHDQILLPAHWKLIFLLHNILHLQPTWDSFTTNRYNTGNSPLHIISKERQCNLRMQQKKQRHG